MPLPSIKSAQNVTGGATVTLSDGSTAFIPSSQLPRGSANAIVGQVYNKDNGKIAIPANESFIATPAPTPTTQQPTSGSGSTTSTTTPTTSTPTTPINQNNLPGSDAGSLSTQNQNTTTTSATPTSTFTPEINQQILRTLIGYTGDVGQGQAQDILARNPQLVDRYVAERRKYEPNYVYNPATIVPANDALASATDAAQRYVSGQGLNYSDFSADIDRALQEAYKSVPYGLDTNASSYFDPNLAANVLNNIQSGRRTQYTNDIYNLLPDSFLAGLVPSTADDAIINNIINEQYTPAEGRLQASRARGLLNDKGYNAAINTLGTNKTAATSRLQDLGSSVLEGLRTDLSNTRKAGLDAASGYTLGQTFDPNYYKTTIDTKLNEGLGGLEGRIRDALGGQELFDVNSSVTKGQVAQGVSNNRGLLDALANREKSGSAGRGLGTQGSF